MKTELQPGYSYTAADPDQLVLVDRPRGYPFIENIGFRGMAPINIKVLYEGDLYRDKNIWIFRQYILGVHGHLGRLHRGGYQGDETHAVRAITFDRADDPREHGWLRDRADLLRRMPKKNPLSIECLEELFPTPVMPKFGMRIEDAPFGPRVVTWPIYD